MEEQLCSEIEQCSWRAISGNGGEEGRRIVAKEEAKSFKRSHELVWSRNRTTEKQNTSGVKQKSMGAAVTKPQLAMTSSFHPRFPFRELNFQEKHQLIRTLQI